MRRSLFVVELLIFSALGCGGTRTLTPDVKGQEILSEVGEIYRQYSFAKKKPPQKFAELASMESVMPGGYHAVKDGTIVLRYGGMMPNLEEGPPEGSSDEILAYEKQVPEQGGQVMMLNRATRRMSPEEFKAAKLAGHP